MVWAGRLGFVPAADAAAHAGAIASANWLASATLVARRVGHGLFVDLGSTTTDILVLAGGEVRALGLTDRERLAAGELVYQGLTRTPVMALAAEAPFAGQRVALMNELFATSADLYRLLELLPEGADQHPAADGGPKTVAASARRLARMIGADLVDGDPADWRRLAGVLARCQLRRIEDAIALQLSRGLIPDAAPLVGAGCGRFLVQRLAAAADRPYRDFAELIEADGRCPRLGGDLRARGGGGTPAGRSRRRHDRPPRLGLVPAAHLWPRPGPPARRARRGGDAGRRQRRPGPGPAGRARPVRPRGRRAGQWRRRCSS